VATLWAIEHGSPFRALTRRLDAMQGHEMQLMLTGEIPGGVDITQPGWTAKLRQLSNADKQRTKLSIGQRKAHAILFLVRAAELDDQNYMGMLKPHFDDLVTLGYNPLPVLARVDETVPAIRDDPTNLDHEVCWRQRVLQSPRRPGCRVGRLLRPGIEPRVASG
jgi:hypothetical protein